MKNLSFLDDVVAIDVERSWFEAPAQEGLKNWLSAVAACRAMDSSTIGVEIAAARWAGWAKLPTDDAHGELADEWRARHGFLASLVDLRAQRLTISTIGHIGARDIEMRCEVDGSRIALGSGRAPIVETAVGSRLLLPAIYEALQLSSNIRAGLDHPEQVEAAGRLKTYALRARELLRGGPIDVQIELDAHLSAMDFREVHRVAPRWETTGRHNDLYDLHLDAVNADGTFDPLPVGRVHPTAPIISVSATEHILLSESGAAVARVAKKTRSKTRRQAAPAIANPTVILPTGISLEDVSLERYSARVAGFEPVLRADRPVDIRASGIAWYGSDDDTAPFLRLEVAQFDGTVEAVEFSGPSEVRDFIAAGTDAAPGAIVRVGSTDVMPTPAIVDKAREALEFYEHREAERTASPLAPPSAPPEMRTRRGTMAAVIKEVESSSPIAEPARVDETDVPWPDLARRLQPQVVLKPHQRQGVAWLWHHRRHYTFGVLLADDMGLGKTIQVASFLALERSRGDAGFPPSLIVAPVILLENWRRELAKFFTNDAFGEVLVLHDKALRSRVRDGVLDTNDLSNFGLIIINYETLARHQQQLLQVEFDTVVLDEAQAIKNPDAIRTRGARGLKRNFAICSTGTPVENRLLDLWALYDFLSPGEPFGSRADFTQRYDSKTPDLPGLRRALGLPSPGSTLLRRTKQGALSSVLPPKLENAVPIAMTEEQVFIERQVVNGAGRNVLETLHDLQKLYQHPRLLKAAKGIEHRTETADALIQESPKLAATIRLLEEVQRVGEKAIIFTLWTGMQELLARVLREKLGLSHVPIINGETNQRGGAQPRLDEFAAADGFAAMILSPLAAGTGLTITAANHVIHYGRWWNPAKEAQATDRAYRIGQTKTVHVHYPILHHPQDPSRGFDVKLHQLVEKKKGLARDFLDPSNADELTADDFASLKEIHE